MLQVTYSDGKVYDYPEGTTFLTIAKNFQKDYASPLVEAVVDGRGQDLQRHLKKSCTLSFRELDTAEGQRVYVRSLFFAFVAAMAIARPEIELELKNAMGDALYCDIKNGIVLSKYDLEAVYDTMTDLIKAKTPIEYKRVKKKEAGNLVPPRLQKDAWPLFSNLAEDEEITMYHLAGQHAFFIGPMLPNLGYLQAFDLRNYKTGILIAYSSGPNYQEIAPFVDQPKLAEIYEESEALGHRIGCPTVAALNKFIEEGNSRGIIQVCEAQQEKKIAQIADTITASQDKIRLVLIAGPSSSGKTTFSQRLSVQMRVNGLNPMPISLDNYFLDRTRTPRLPDGSYDFESINALDLDLFNEHLEKLIAGATVKIPHYNFRTGRREFRGQTINLGEHGVLVVEGIHGLNERLSQVVEKNQKLKIYISALTPLSFDDYNRIQTTDMRLLRRIVRDSQFRSHDAVGTIAGWSKVREGEEKYIFPFSEEADIMLNTTLIYEFAVFKKYAEPLLKAIPPDIPEAVEANRLLNMLRVVSSIDDAAVPKNSIIREFVGGSIFGDLL